MPEPGKILVLMLRRIGDVVLTTAAVRALRRRFPRAEIHFLAEPPGAEALAGDPHIDRVLRYAAEPGEGAAASYWRWLRSVRAERYDWVIDYMGNPRSAMLAFATGARLRAGPAHVWHRWAYNRPLAQSPRACYAGIEKLRMLRGLGIEADESDFLPNVHVPGPSSARAAEALARLWPAAGGPLCGLVPASRKRTRRWPAAAYGRLARLLGEEAGARVLILWGPGERALAEEVELAAGGRARLAPETPSVKDLAAFLRRCQLVVTNCNGPKHIAVACGTPTVTVHGSSDPACWNPPHPSHVVARREELACIGCRQNECPIGTIECLRDLPAESVARSALALLAAQAPKT